MKRHLRASFGFSLYFFVSLWPACSGDAANPNSDLDNFDLTTTATPDGGANGDLALTPTEQPTSLGATPLPDGGVRFWVWAPAAEQIFVAGSWNGFAKTTDAMVSDGDGGFTATIASAEVGDEYRYVITAGGETFEKNDPRARAVSAGTRSVIVDPRATSLPAFVMPARDEQIIYELHLGTFYRGTAANPMPGTFTTATEKLDHLAALGVNLIELMPVHQFNGQSSWGYNPALPFAVARSYGTPAEMRAFVAAAHARGIGVLIDVVHNHYSGQSLVCFDGDCGSSQPNGIYFYGAGDRASTPWGPRPNFSRDEVRRYITDNAIMWLDEYGADGMRWDSVSNIRAIDNGAGAANPDGASLLVSIMGTLHQRYPNALQIAEDLGGRDDVTGATAENGLGFDTQWDAGFFHPVDDTVIAANDSDRHMNAIADALRRRYNDRALARVVYSESHDEVANGKARIPQMIDSDDPASLTARKRSTLAAAIVMTAPGVPMLFMGQEFLTRGSFSDTLPLDWTMAETHAGILALYKDLIALRKNRDGHTAGLRSDDVDVFHVNDGAAAKVVIYRRRHASGDVVVAANFSATAFGVYELGMPAPGTWKIRFNSDDKKYGSDFGGATQTEVTTTAVARDGFAQKTSIALPPYSAIILSQ